MDYIRIGDRGLLFSLSAEDLLKYGTNRKTAVRQIVSDVGEACGFSTNGRYYVQMYESRAGGCELFVTKLEERGERARMNRCEERLNEFSRREYIDRRAVYVFHSLDHLVLACRMVVKAGYRGRSEVFADAEHERFYLILEESSVYPAEAMGKICKRETYFFVREHCKKLYGDRAAEVLSTLA